MGIIWTTAKASGALASVITPTTGADRLASFCDYTTIPAAGWHRLVWLEYSAATGTTTWLGDAGAPKLYESGMQGTIRD